MLGCPKCRGYMLEQDLRGIQIDLCSRCEGIWLDRGELAVLAETPDDLPEADGGVNDTVYRCPRCSSALKERRYSQQYNLQIDVCAECRGVYLDRGELNRIERFAKDVNAVFTPERVGDFRRRTRRYEALSSIYHTEKPAAKQPLSERSIFIRNVYLLLTATLFVTAATAAFGVRTGLAVKWFWPALIAEIVVFIAALCCRRIRGLNVALLFAYTGLSGFTLAALLMTYIAAGYGAVIWQAAALTGVIFLALSAYVHITKADFSWLGGMLFVGLIALIVAGLWFLFVGGSAFSLFIYSVIGAVIFCGYILYDTSNIILKYATSETVSAVIDLHLDIVNLFIDLLRILSYLQGRD